MGHHSGRMNEAIREAFRKIGKDATVEQIQKAIGPFRVRWRGGERLHVVVPAARIRNVMGEWDFAALFDRQGAAPMTRVELPALIWAMDRGREAFERIQAGGCDEGDATLAKLYDYVLDLHRQRVGPQTNGDHFDGSHG